MQAPVVVYNLNMQKKAYLENAFNAGYKERYNSLWHAHFSIPADDPKKQYCQPLWYVEIFDGGQRIDLFRIIPSRSQHDGTGKTVTYQCEHVLATLLDDILFKYHQFGGRGVYTEEVLQYVLSFQQVQRWRLGTVAFARQFLYNWENENLLAALFSVPKPFVEEYCWMWDTSNYPWTLNLVEADEALGPEIRYRRNLRGVEVEEDPTELCTRLYVLGYGEGVNQLGIESVNPTGLPYIDADTQEQFGIIKRVWVDRRYEDAENLYNSAVAALEKMKVPRISVSVSAADLFKITKDPLDKFVLGRKIRVYDEDLGLDYTSRVITRNKRDVQGAPGDITLEIANVPRDIAGSIAELADRTRVNEVYAQGATNLDSHNFTDNCDPDYPATMRFWVPEETVRINKILLNYSTEAFRAYSKAIEGGGRYADTVASGGYYANTVASGGAYSSTTPSGGGHTSGSSSRTTTTTENENINITGYIFIPGPIVDNTQGWKADADNHNHGISTGTRLALDGGGHVTYYAFSGSHHVHGLYNHGHHYTAYGHNHGMNHTHTVQDHTHGFSVPNHTHGFSVPNHTHEFSIPDHEHEIKYGIFQGPMPTNVEVRVDGNLIPGLGTAETDVDIIPYLSKDAGGRILRGWHAIEIKPNTLGRVVANVVCQFFVQSRGGGNY